LFCSMCLYLIQCAFVLIYVPLFRSMSLYLVPCAFVLIYVPSSCSMDRHLVLCSIIPFYEPLSHSMCRPLILWTFHPTHSTPYSINSKRPRYIKVTGAFIYATSFLVISLMSRSGCRFSSLFLFSHASSFFFAFDPFLHHLHFYSFLLGVLLIAVGCWLFVFFFFSFFLPL